MSGTTIYTAPLADGVDNRDAADLCGLTVNQLTHARRTRPETHPAHIQLTNGTVVYSRQALLEWIAAGGAPGGRRARTPTNTVRVPRGRRLEWGIPDEAAGRNDDDDDGSGGPAMAMRPTARRADDNMQVAA